jgi:hypothetical protein
LSHFGLATTVSTSPRMNDWLFRMSDGGSSQKLFGG